MVICCRLRSDQIWRNCCRNFLCWKTLGLKKQTHDGIIRGAAPPVICKLTINNHQIQIYRYKSVYIYINNPICYNYRSLVYNPMREFDISSISPCELLELFAPAEHTFSHGGTTSCTESAFRTNSHVLRYAFWLV